MAWIKICHPNEISMKIVIKLTCFSLLSNLPCFYKFTGVKKMRKLTLFEVHSTSGGALAGFFVGIAIGSLATSSHYQELMNEMANAIIKLATAYSNANEKLEQYQALYGDLPSQSNTTAA